MRALRIGTRGSPLALWQARTVAALLERQGRPSEIQIITTSGDRLQEAPLSEAGGKGLFVKEIEDALIAGAIDLAVHSAKDMSAVWPDGLGVVAVLPREDSRDALVLPQGDAQVGRLVFLRMQCNHCHMVTGKQAEKISMPVTTTPACSTR